jgi:hypothetical protein
MTGKSYEAARIAELERPDGWSPIRRRFAVQAFGINAWSAHEPGAAVIPEHDERPSGHEELYLVTAGRASAALRERKDLAETARADGDLDPIRADSRLAELVA